MTTAAQICNTALVPLKRAIITSLTQGTPSANDAVAIYDELRKRLLRRHDWNFARKRVKLAQETGTPVSGFLYAYQIPTADWLRTVVVSDSDLGLPGVPYRLEQDSILSDAQQIYLTYIFDVTDEAQMPADFRDYFSYSLGMSLAKTSTQRKEMKELRDEAQRTAMSVDSIEDAADDVPDGDWYTDRFL